MRPSSTVRSVRARMFSRLAGPKARTCRSWAASMSSGASERISTGHDATASPRRTPPRLVTGRRRAASGVDLLHDLVGDVEVGEDVLHVVAVLQRLQQAEALLGVLLVQRHAHAGHEVGLGGLVVDPGLLQ